VHCRQNKYGRSIGGLFPTGLRSPRVSGCGVRIVRLTENPCAALPSWKNPHLWIGHLNMSSSIVDGHELEQTLLKEKYSFHFTDEYGFTLKPFQ
jgi:hypothetical protein